MTLARYNIVRFVRYSKCTRPYTLPTWPLQGLVLPKFPWRKKKLVLEWFQVVTYMALDNPLSVKCRMGCDNLLPLNAQRPCCVAQVLPLVGDVDSSP